MYIIELRYIYIIKRFTHNRMIIIMNQTKIIFKVRDSTFNHEPPFLQDTERIHFVRNCVRGSNGDVPINSGDVVLYSDKWFTNIHPDSKANIALLIESPEIDPVSYNYISENNNKFDIVLTYNKEFLDRGENFNLNLYGTSWMADPYIRIWKKSKMCSIITSPKLITTGHKLRHEIIMNIVQNNKDVTKDNIVLTEKIKKFTTLEY